MNTYVFSYLTRSASVAAARKQVCKQSCYTCIVQKRDYRSPEMKVVELRQHANLLGDSDRTPGWDGQFN